MDKQVHALHKGIIWTYGQTWKDLQCHHALRENQRKAWMPQTLQTLQVRQRYRYHRRYGSPTNPTDSTKRSNVAKEREESGCPHFPFFRKKGQRTVRIPSFLQKADNAPGGSEGQDERHGAHDAGRSLRRKPCPREGATSEACCDAGRGAEAAAVLGARRRIGRRSHARMMRGGRKKRAWRLPTLPHRCSTIGVRALDFRVRDGNGYFHSAMATKPTQTLEPDSSDAWSGCSGLNAGTRWTIWSSRSDD